MKQEEIQTLLDRYLDGETTNDEEQLLRQYFSTVQIVPPEWRPYKALFGWEQRHATAAMPQPAAVSTPKRPVSRLAIAASIAALLLVGAGIATSLLRQPAETAETAQNYAVIDGHVTTDAALIAQEAELALMMVSTTEEETFDALNIMEI